jgi:hypothetical protein
MPRPSGGHAITMGIATCREARRHPAGLPHFLKRHFAAKLVIHLDALAIIKEHSVRLVRVSRTSAVGRGLPSAFR